MGDVFLARMGEGEGEWIALKRIRREVQDDPVLARQFEREARICALLSHQNIVELKAFGTDEAGPYLALEFIDGASAARLVSDLRERQEHLSVGAALSIARDAAKALLYAHHLSNEGGSGLLHRDVSPDNILITRDGVAKLSDFGIAKIMGGTNLTRTGVVKGKFAYMAPELLEGEEANEKTDTFAFAATVYFLLCGVTAFQGRSEAELVRAVLGAVPPPPSDLRDGVPEAVDAWVNQSLSKEPRVRRSLEEFLSITEPLIHSVPGEGRPLVAQALDVIPHLFTAPTRVDQPAVSQALAPTLASPDVRAQNRWPLVVVLSFAAAVALGLVLPRIMNGSDPHPQPVSQGPEDAGAAPLVVIAEPPASAAPDASLPVPVAVEIAPIPNRHSAKPVGHPKERKALVLTRVDAGVSGTPAAAVVERPPVKDGELWIKVHPWAHVFFDGKLRGVTPLDPISASPGEHTLILVNEDLKVKRTLSVNVRPGESTEVREDLAVP